MGRELDLPIWYYRQFPSDFRLGEEATRGILGWGQRTCRIPQDRMALVLMHFWNIGFPGGPEWNVGSPQTKIREAQEYVGRCVMQFTRTMPPIIAAAREAGMTIVHVASSEDYASKYPQYEATCAQVDMEPQEEPPGAIRPEQTDIPSMAERFGPGYDGSVKDVGYDFPPGIAPEGDDLVCVYTHQLNSVMRQREIWCLTYCGFAINWCLWHSPCGMVDMQKLGYTSGCVRQGVVAVESRESVSTLANHAYSMWKTAHMFGFVVDDNDFIAALANPVA